MAKRYTDGKYAVGECARSGRKMLLKDMVADGYYPNLKVDPAWYEGKHPQESLPEIEDPVALWRPAPEREKGATNPVLSIVITGTPSCDLTWTEAEALVNQISEYQVFRAVKVGANPIGAFVLLATLPVTRDFIGNILTPLLHTTYSDTAVDFGTETYQYRIDAIPVRVGTGQSPQTSPGRSNIVACGTRPSTVTLSGMKSGDDIQLNWTASTPALNPIASYCLYRSVNGGAFTLLVEVGGAVLMYLDTDVTNPPDTYDYYVIAKDSIGVESLPSNIVSFGLTSGLLVAVANAGSAGFRVMTSPDGIAWTLRASAANDPWNGLAIDTRAGGLWVAVSTNGTAQTSSDGFAWTLRTAVLGQWQDVAFSEQLDLYVAVGTTGTSQRRVMTSSDGITWSPETTPVTADILWETVVWNDVLDLFVAGSQATGGVGTIMTSPDGSAWTHRATPTDSVTGLSVNPGNGRMVTSNRANNSNMWSTDGVTWNLVTPNGLPGGMTGITYDTLNSQFVAVTSLPVANRAATSADGTSWTQRATPGQSWEGVDFSVSQGLLVATAASVAGGNQVMTSPDGITWTQRSTPDAGDPGDWDAVREGVTPV